MNPCELSREAMQAPPMRCVRKDARCNYHRRGEAFAVQDLFPGGICPAAFHALYRPSLGLLFGARGIGERVRCPGVAAGVTLRSRFVPLSLRFAALNVVKRLASPLLSGQVHPGRLVWRVERVEGACPMGMVEDMEFFINLGRLELCRSVLLPMGEPLAACPAVAAAWYPLACSGQGECAVCPDGEVNITLTSGGSGS